MVIYMFAFKSVNIPPIDVVTFYDEDSKENSIGGDLLFNFGDSDISNVVSVLIYLESPFSNRFILISEVETQTQSMNYTAVIPFGTLILTSTDTFVLIPRSIYGESSERKIIIIEDKTGLCDSLCLYI